MEKRRLYIQRVLSALLLLVFAIALTPFGAFHHHGHDHAHDHDHYGYHSHEQTNCSTNKKDCGHKLHIGVKTEHCLVCEAHFEKNYTTAKTHFHIYLESKPLQKFYDEVSSSYTKLISRSLRGPPVV